jgi:hypothetical protein
MREYRCLIIGYSSRGRIRSDTKKSAHHPDETRQNGTLSKIP